MEKKAPDSPSVEGCRGAHTLRYPDNWTTGRLALSGFGPIGSVHVAEFTASRYPPGHGISKSFTSECHSKPEVLARVCRHGEKLASFVRLQHGLKVGSYSALSIIIPPPSPC